MPFKSKAQQRWMFAAEDRGEVPKGTAERWADHTKNIDDLPARVKKSAQRVAMRRNVPTNAHGIPINPTDAEIQQGVADAIAEVMAKFRAGGKAVPGGRIGVSMRGQPTKYAALQTAYDIGRMHAMVKEAALGDRAVSGLLTRTAHMWAPAAGGAALAGPEYRTEGALAGLVGGMAGRGLMRRFGRHAFFSPEELRLLERTSARAPLDADLAARAATFERSMPLVNLGAGVAGGAGAGYLVREGMKQTPAGAYGLATEPAVSDMGGHYSGLVPEGYY